MGLFSFLRDAAAEASDDAHGARLLNELNSTFLTLENQDKRVQYAAVSGFLRAIENIDNKIFNVSREGRIELARALQNEARNGYDYDLAGSFSKWLTGAWIESRERKSSLKAQQAFRLMEQFIIFMKTK